MVLVWALVAVAAIWVAVDASGRDWSDDRFADAAWKWIVGVLLLWFVALPLYLVHRRRAPRLGMAAAVSPSGAAAFAAPEKPMNAETSVPPPGQR